MPFEKATIDEFYYKFIAGNKPHKFWKFFKKEFSNDFKDLITGLLQLNPEARLTHDEIIAHPWV